MSHTVLIVDDSKLARLVVIKALTALRPDWPRVEASDADKALAMAAEQPIDISLLDYNMPGTNGLDLAAMLREKYPTMPIAVISANIQDEIIAGARKLDAGFLPKPVTEEALGAFLSGAALRLKMSTR